MCAAPLLVSLLFLISGASAQRPPSQAELAAMSQRGKELMAAGRYGEAIPVYSKLVKALPGNPGLILNLGMALHLAGRDKEAVPLLETALRLQPQSLPTALFLGASNLRLGRTAAAVPLLEKVVRLDAENREARSMLVEVLLSLERYARAEPHLRRLAQLTPSDPAVWFHLGKTYEALAGQAFDDLLKLDPESPFALALEADARLKQDQRGAAFQLYRKAIERGPTLRGLRAAVASIYRSSGHPDWAAIEDERERQLPKPDCSREILECAFAGGKYNEAREAASKSRTPAAHYWRVRACNELAVEAFGRLSALPASAESHEWLAEAHRNERRYAESAEEWRQAIARTSGDPRLKLQLAITLRLNQDLEGARQVLEELVREQPDAPEPNALLGDVLLAQQQPERAIPVLEKAVRAAPKEPHARGDLGRAYALVGRAADAIPHLEQALAADVDGSLRYQLARSYQATGQAEKAEKALKDYEAFRKTLEAGAGDSEQGASITPP